MTARRRGLFARVLLIAVLALAACVVLGAGRASALIAYNDAGGMSDGMGGWILPLLPVCQPDDTKISRPECVAVRLPVTTSAADCVGAGGSSATALCNDVVNNGSQGACEGAYTGKC